MDWIAPAGWSCKLHELQCELGWFVLIGRESCSIAWVVLTSVSCVSCVSYMSCSHSIVHLVRIQSERARIYGPLVAHGIKCKELLAELTIAWHRHLSQWLKSPLKSSWAEMPPDKFQWQISSEFTWKWLISARRASVRKQPTPDRWTPPRTKFWVSCENLRKPSTSPLKTSVNLKFSD